MGFRSWKFIEVVISIFLFFCSCSCSAEKAPYYTFVRETTSAPSTMSYDYIIIGGGTSGCALAATLSRDATVLVLERGSSPYVNPDRNDLENFLSNLLNTSPSSPAQQFISEDGVHNARARILGGGSVINAGFYSRASAGFVKKAGWDESLVNESYEWVEKVVAFEPRVLEWQSKVRDGLLEVGVLPYNGFTYDHINGTKIGGTIFDKEGHRHTAADLLEYADPRRISVYLHATVHKILFRDDNGRERPEAYGVIFEDANGVKHTGYLNKNSLKNDVILSAGALGSPQLLMLSGVGPAQHLMAHGIKVVVDQPMVGQGMADNPMNILYVPSPLPVEVSLIQAVGITEFGSFIEAASGLSFSYGFAQRVLEEFGLILNQTIQISQLFTTTRETISIHESGKTDTVKRIKLRGGVILEKIDGPLSTGHLELQNTNPEDNPKVTFNYFKDPEDLRRCVEAMKIVINVVNSKAFSKFRYDNVPVKALVDLIVALPLNERPRHVSAGFDLQQFCIDTVLTIWHYHGGCQVGKVVDADYRVLGVDSLRVVDGSTFLASPGTNPQATVMMLGRYVGQRILSERIRNNRKKQKITNP